MISQNTTFNDSDKGSIICQQRLGWLLTTFTVRFMINIKIDQLMIFMVYDIHGASALGCCKGFGLNSTLAR